MSNTFSPSDVASVALAAAGKTTGLVSRAYRDAEANFGRGIGASVDVRVYSTQAHETTLGNTSALTVSDVNETIHPVTLTARLYVRNQVTAADALSLESFSGNITVPATIAVLDAAETKIAAVYNGLTAHATIKYSPANPRTAIVSARAALLSAGVPLDAPLYVEASATAYADFLNAGMLDVASLANLGGVTIHESPRITGDAFVIHSRKAVAAAFRAPEVFSASAQAASLSQDGYALTQVTSYSTETGSEDSLLSTLYGVAVMGEPVFDATDGTASFVPSALKIVKATA